MKSFNRLFSFVIFIMVMVFVCSIFFIRYYSSKIGPAFIMYAESEARRITTLVINKSITKELNNGYDIDSMFNVVRNNNNEIEMIDFNTVNVNNILTSITDLIERNLEAITLGEDVDMNLSGVSDVDYEMFGKGVIFEVPMGSFVSNSLIANIGPKVPVRLNMVGDVVSNVETNVHEYGINNALIEVGIRVNVKTMIYTPFISKEVNVEEVIPVSVKVISGNIPSYYFDGFNSSSNLVGAK